MGLKVMSFLRFVRYMYCVRHDACLRVVRIPREELYVECPGRILLRIDKASGKCFGAGFGFVV